MPNNSIDKADLKADLKESENIALKKVMVGEILATLCFLTTTLRYNIALTDDLATEPNNDSLRSNTTF